MWELLDIIAEHLGVGMPALREIRIAADVASEIVLGFT